MQEGGVKVGVIVVFDDVVVVVGYVGGGFLELFHSLT